MYQYLAVGAGAYVAQDRLPAVTAVAGLVREKEAHGPGLPVQGLFVEAALDVVYHALAGFLQRLPHRRVVADIAIQALPPYPERGGGQGDVPTMLSDGRRHLGGGKTRLSH